MPNDIEKVYNAWCFERTRRMAEAALVRAAEPEERRKLLLWQYRAALRLGDPARGRLAAAALPQDTPAACLERELLLAGVDFPRTQGEHYRTSEEGEAGLSIDEYMQKYRKIVDAGFRRAAALATAPELKETFARELQRLRIPLHTYLPGYVLPVPPAPPEATFRSVSWSGRLTDASGRGVPGVRLEAQHSGSRFNLDYHHVSVIPDCGGILQRIVRSDRARRFTAMTDAEGNFRFETLPATRYDYLAAITPKGSSFYPVVFLDRDFEVTGMDSASYVLREWVAAPVAPVAAPPVSRRVGSAAVEVLSFRTVKNPFDYRFPRQAMSLPIPTGVAPADLMLLDDRGETPIPFQMFDGEALFMATLAPEASSTWSFCRRPAGVIDPASRLRAETHGAYIEISTGNAAYRIAGPEAAPGTPPILALKGPDGVWRGKSRLVLAPGIGAPKVSVRCLEAGPVMLRYEVRLVFDSGAVWRYELTFYEGECTVLVRENSVRLDETTSWEIGFPEFIGERAFLNGSAEDSGMHWFSPVAEDRELARIQESVAWWLPGQVFGFGLSFDGLEKHDYIGVFSLRRGDWRDDDFARIASGPGDEQRELDWPFPEMVGSTLSMLTVHSRKSGEVAMRFAGFNGERQWGLCASDFDRNDGPYRELSQVQHKNSSPRLVDFAAWTLDAPETLPRPLLLARRDTINLLRERTENEPFKSEFDRIRSERGGDYTGMAAVLGQDAERLWLLGEWVLRNAHLRSKVTLQGRDSGDTYSPVGGRPITPMAAAYDMLAPTGVFSADEERMIRAYFMLMGHMYMEADFMNWHYNSRNANFEADRVDIVGNIGLVFPENPDSKIFAEHSVELMRRSLEVYCTPGSGKWYENPACYYLHASSCRLNLVYHLWKQGRFDSSEIDRLKDFLRWGILLLTPNAPTMYDNWTKPGNWFGFEHSRLVPPVGDHAELGKRLSDFYWLLAPMYDKRDPAFAAELRWAWQVTHRGENGFRSPHLLLATDNPPPAKPDYPAPTLASRRLEGYGALVRGKFGTPDESYLLFKLGPGGYRYHRSEGSFLYFAHGRPLVYDGGEAGETWRHATLSFYDTHMPLAPGHIERFAVVNGSTLAQGVNPCAVKPGDPVFLSDRCDHQLVPLALARYAEPNPLNARTMLSVRDEYVVLHDDLNGDTDDVPTFWHLPVVGDSVEKTGENEWRFAGRFGVDLQLSIPGAPVREAKVDTIVHEEYGKRRLPFTMTHLQLQLERPRVIGAILHPLTASSGPVQVRALWNGTRQVGLEVRGENGRDLIFLNREEVEYAADGVRFRGRYGLVEERDGVKKMALFDGGELEFKGRVLRSEGTASEVF